MKLRWSGRRGVTLVIIMLLATAFVVAGRMWRVPPYYTLYGTMALPTPIMTAVEYDKVVKTHPRPFIFECRAGKGGVLFFGIEHTRDADDPQLADLVSRWDAFKPNAVLIEGRLGFFLDGFGDPVATFGESGLAFARARQKNIAVYTWEPPLDQEIALVLEKHPKEQVALYYVLSPYVSGLRHGKPADPEALVERYRRRRTVMPGLENTLKNVAQIDAIWQRDFPDQPDWRDTSDQYGWPGYLGDVARTANAVRDEHLARCILHLAQRGQRVLVLAGASHAVKLQPAIRGALAEREKEKAKAAATKKK